ncbi:putative RNA polymerase [Achromobacter phage vB_AxyP_19-32_Axy23]|uniref:DNA-directed RNA polymerase n=1 Tax=Achromobacter phage vB_AxyP_19-32_Axy23 TaxID=2591047 RepID=A0A514CW45_9CAUD|nr:putative RNA polymerase [Achromobacter phage vB_AxyP_19-32_Axy23]
MDKRAAQLQYEIDNDVAAAAARLHALQQAAAEGDLSLPRAKRFLARAFKDVAAHIDNTKAVATRGRGGKFKGWLRSIPTDVAAVIAIRTAMQLATAVRSRAKAAMTAQALCSNIGRLYELELRIDGATAVNPLYMKKVHDQIKERGTTAQHHIRAVYSKAYSQVMKGYESAGLNEAEIVQLGRFGLDALYETGIVTAERSYISGGTLVAFDLAPEVHEFLVDYTDKDVQLVASSRHMPMQCPPDPWVGLYGGGFLSERRKLAFPLLRLHKVRKSERARLRGEFTAERMPKVFATANYLQSQAFALHQPTLQAILGIWRAGGGMMGVPSKHAPADIPCPFPPTWSKHEASEDEVEVFHRWKRQRVAWYDACRQWRSHVSEMHSFMRITEDQWPEFYLPVFVDSRGRWYYRGALNPQGSDMCKGVITFAKKKPLGKAGVTALQVHIANSLGYDKVRLEARAAWTRDNWEALEAALDDPAASPEVWGKDNSWCAYAAAWELREAYRSGNPEAYECGIIVHWDATCSGLQHFAAILRDEVGGAMVNLFDKGGPEKADIYTSVASSSLEAMAGDLGSEDAEIAARAAWWRENGIPRDWAKKPVMTYSYSATVLGTADHLTDKMEEYGTLIPPGMRMHRLAAYGGKKLFDGIASTNPAAAALMRWFQDVVMSIPKGQGMEWRSPSGFLVRHDYQDYDETVVMLRSCGLREVVVRQRNEDTVPHQMRNAIAPNYIHSCDAAHATLTANEMEALGLNFVGIHDSFGSHACDALTLNDVLRRTFVQMYEENDVLFDFLWSVKGFATVPLKGKLDLKQVLNSEFFFC